MNILKTAVEQTDTSDWRVEDFPYQIENIPMRPELHDLCKRLLVSQPKWKFTAGVIKEKTRTSFHVENNKIMGWVDSWHNQKVYADVFVYTDNCDYILGRLCFGDDYAVSVNAGLQWVTESRRISNNKFGEQGPNFHRVYTANIEKAVKNCLMYLTPYSPKEMGELTARYMRGNVEESISKVKRELKEVLHHDDEVFLREMRNLIAQNVQFSTPEFITMASNFIQADNKYTQERSRKRDVKFVVVRMVGDTQWLDVVDIPNILEISWHPNFKDCVGVSMPITDAPQELVGRLAVLSSLNNKQYVNEVGQRSSENTFWVEL